MKEVNLKIAVHQMRSGIDVRENTNKMVSAIRDSADAQAKFYFAPEMSSLIDKNRIRAAQHIHYEDDSFVLPLIREVAAETGIWVHIGSIPVRCERDSNRFANRSLIINGAGDIVARYDKMHLFDATLLNGEAWRESNAYLAGEDAVLIRSPIGNIGMTICYDLRFPDLYSALARAGADIFAIPSAFTVPTGQAHWHSLLKARAIESACFVIAAAQSGTHDDGRQTYGHSLVIDPWGEVLLDMGEGEGLGYAEIDLQRIDEVRSQIPVHLNRRDIGKPKIF
jgi:deaminated glutathione amidase